MQRPATGQATSNCNTDLATDEYAVYSTLLLHKFGGRQFVIHDHTAASPKPSGSSSYDEWVSGHWQRCESMVPPDEPSMLAQFRERNREPHILTRNFKLPNYALVSGEETKKRMAYDMKKPGGGGVNEVYPDATGVIYLSSIGFNETRTRAVAYVVRGSCGRGCGEGFCVFLSKEGCEWKVGKAETFWMG